jgi:NAD(P)-dependent dehydrogenase (short-subunit alcohol dehydrogenase family)
MSQEGRFVDQVVLITGAARGQGRAHALAFALSMPEELAAVAQEIAAFGRKVIARPVDVVDQAAMQALVEEAHTALGPVSIAIVNAGLYSFGPTWELSEQQWEETLNVVLKGTWITCKVMIPQMVAGRSC